MPCRHQGPSLLQYSSTAVVVVDFAARRKTDMLAAKVKVPAIAPLW